ncbi:MAG: SH3 domain-containing protein [Christensenellales bacterium]
MTQSKKVLVRLFVILIIVALITAIIATYAGQSHATDNSVVRVKLSVGTPSQLAFSLFGNYRIGKNQNIGISTGSYMIKVSGSTLNLYCGSTLLCTGTDITIEECPPFEGKYNYTTIKTTTYGTNTYLGNIQFKLDESHIDVINHVYLEYYLYGVVPHEMSNSWPIEALKAQAVAARTYAVRYMNGSGSYDLVDTSSNQVYKGYNGSNTNAIKAVNDTAKIVLKCQGALVQTFYSASNGGYVDIPQHLWSLSAPILPYHILQQDPYDTQNTWSLEEVLIFPKTVTKSNKIAYQYSSSGSMVDGTGSERANAERYLKISALPSLAAKGYIASVSGDIEIVGINSIVPHSYEGQHGSVSDYTGTNSCVCFQKADINMAVLAYRPSTQEEQQLTGQALVQEQISVGFTINLHELDKSGGVYQAFNNKSLRLFIIVEKGSDWRIYNRRYGHGVGLSQRGAQTRAKGGQTFDQILSFYYPNTYFEALNISPPDLGEATDSTDQTNAVVYNCVSNVNIRSTPDTSYPRIGTAFLGDRITVIEANAAPDWHKISYGGIDAYIYAYYVMLDSEAAPTPTVPAKTPSATVEPSPPTTSALPTATPTATPAPDIVQTGTVSVNVLNIRSGPGTTYSQIGRFAKGDRVDVIETNSAQGWHKILSNGIAGYVYASYITLSDTETNVQTTGVITASILNIRSGPGTSYSKLGSFVKGNIVDVIEADSAQGWHKILYKGSAAYVYAQYVRLSGPETSIQTTGVITASILNIRSGPGTSYTKLGSFVKGAKVDITKINETENWHQILYNGSAAYVHADYVSISNSGSAGNASEVQANTVYASVNANALNFREAASLSAPVINTLSRGDIVQVLEKGTTWHKVKYAGKKGYMYAQYLKISSSTYGVVSAGTLNIRNGASTSTAVLGKLYKGNVVEIIEKGNTWHKIRFKSSTAYVYAAYIKLS